MLSWFVSKVEEVLNDWKLIGSSVHKPLEKGEFHSGTWEEKTEEISFADYKFTVTHHYLKEESPDGEEKEEPEEDAFPAAMQDLLCMNNDFPPRAHCLVRWYGVREFVVISPGANNDAIISESKCNLLLSSVSIALGNTGSQVPLFVQIQQKWRRMYAGECQGPGVRTDFEMVHLRKVPNQYNHLSGLLDIFKSKIRFRSCSGSSLVDFDALLGGEVGGVEFGKLPFGACEDPISELHLATTWPHLTEGIIVDNDVYSDLDPVQAPHWSVRLRKADNPQCLLGKKCLLYDFLSEFFKLCCRKESTEEILGMSPLEEEGKENADISQALSKLTEPTTVPIHKLSVSSMVHSARKRMRRHRRVEESPLSNEVLNSILLYLFSDAAEKPSNGSEAKPGASNANRPPEKVPENYYLFSDAAEKPSNGSEAKPGASNANRPPEKEPENYNLYNQFKSSPADSLTYKLSLCLCMVNFYHGGVKGVVQLWQEFVLEMRCRWENNFLVPGLASGPPDLRCCLLHQKLQMLNCCIERKKARDNGKRPSPLDSSAGSAGEKKASGSDNGKAAQNSSGTEDRRERGEANQGKTWESWSDSEEEFFECLSDTEELKENAQDNEKKEGPPKENKDAPRLKAEGRLRPHGKLTLLHYIQEPLYIPVTQEPAPMTEDLLEEQSEVLAKLGTSAEGAHLRARMQSACLLSDMESFKAANPGCCLEDFVRWYSPRDYVEEEVLDEKGNTITKGELSTRMKIPGNMWAEAWETAKPAPARRQRRLFDDTREAEKAANPGCCLEDFVRWYSPRDYVEEEVLDEKGNTITKGELSTRMKIPGNMWAEAWETAKPAPARRQRRLFDDTREAEKEIINQIMAVETIIARARSLKAKFGISKCENIDEREELESIELFLKAALMTLMDEESVKSGSQEERRQNPGAVSDFPPPAGREIILRTVVPRPAPYSKPLPQRMFCVLMKEDFRLAGAFSSDTSFF
ncbi:UNVERIFIED_CONTAM: hypothetical protein FKN15_021176 [Acipenser sinensis]